MKEKEKQKTQKPEKEAPLPEVVLWPFLLSKALLKLANLTMNKDKDLLDFNIVHCLTGWVLQKVELKGMPLKDMWEICKTYTKMYSWEDHEVIWQSPTVDKQKKDKKDATKEYLPFPENSNKSHYFMALCKDMRTSKQSVVNGISPCWGHEILIDEYRNIPLDRPPPDPQYPLWKKFRWMEWARSKRLIEDPVAMDTTRYVRCVSPFKKYTELVVNKEPSQDEKIMQFPLRKSLAAAQRMQLNPEKETKGADNDIRTGPDLYRIDKSKERKSIQEPPPNPNIWVRFDEICSQLISFNIFYKPSAFCHKARISDMELNELMSSSRVKSATSMKDNEDSCRDMTWAKVLEERGNMPLYFFIDSLQPKMILMNFAQAGDLERLVPLEDELSEHNFFVEYERLFGDRSKNLDESFIPPKKLKLNRAKIHASLNASNVIFERYKWDSAGTGKVKFFLNTYGSATSQLELKPGRHIFRMWIKSTFSYCITILADTGFTVGCFEHILEEMSEETMRMTQFNLNIADSFGRLVQGFGTDFFPDYLHDFYSSYLPQNANKELTKHQRAIIHSNFMTSLLQFLQFSQDFFSVQKMIEALRTLFIDRNIRIGKQVSPVYQEPLQFQSLQEKIICERAATKLQSFFKGVQIRILLKRHSPGNDYFPEICETLRNMYREHFSLERRDECLGSIIRNFFKNSKISDLLCFYEISRDFKWDLMVQTYTGSSELTRDYVILCRYILRCHTDVVLSIELFSSLTNYALRIIDNDTGVEIYRFSNRVFPGIYKPNTYGYTIIGFAWYKDVMLINWKLAVISSRTTANAFEIEEVKTTTTMAFDHYVPICKGLIGKHSIFVRENVIFTFRFSCSFKDVKFNIRLLDTTQNPIVDIVGTEKFIIPSILLKYSASSEMAPHMVKTRSSKSLLVPRSSGRYIRGDSRKSMERPSSKKESISARKVKDTNMEMSSVTEFEPHVYSLEFYVLDNSWPLTKMEWEVVRKLREDMYFINANKETELVIKESSSKSIVKSAKDTRKSMLKKVQSIEKPWYLLQYSLKSNAQVALVKDKSEEDKLYNLKKSWYQMDADRYSRSFELRQKYLRKYTDPGCECPEEYLNPTPTASIGRMTDMSFETTTNSGPLREEDDENESRSITCPKWTEADVPPFDLTPYYRPQCPCPLDLRRKIIKTEEDHIVAREERLQMIEEYNTLLAKKRYDMELWINESNERRTLVFLWYADCRKASERIFQEDHVMRQNFIDKWTAELSGPAKQDKKGPSKTDKK
ncbi:androglobin-like isoform X2 [Harmonia axyridis]|nr:androglobin-like isoform X2 [Harmonia axyridis]